jgi:hypothetical protein
VPRAGTASADDEEDKNDDDDEYDNDEDDDDDDENGTGLLFAVCDGSKSTSTTEEGKVGMGSIARHSGDFTIPDTTSLYTAKRCFLMQALSRGSRVAADSLKALTA